MPTLFSLSNGRYLRRVAIIAQVAMVPIVLACSDDESPTRAPASRLTGPSSAPASFAKGGLGKGGPAAQQRIAYISNQRKLRTMKPDGSDMLELAGANAVEDASPAWSPDYQKIVFTSNRGSGLSSVFIVNADMTGLTQVTTGLFVHDPTFSADGTKIAFATASLTGNWDIWVHDLATGQRTQLTTDPSGDTYPHWSPDGTRILFSSYRDGHAEVYQMNADGSNQTRVTYCGIDCYMPAWAPDGNRIVFTGKAFGETVFVTAPGDPLRYLPVTAARVGASGYNRHPGWSPDGKKVVFDGLRDGVAGIVVANADGSGAVNLTPGEYASQPTWRW